MHAEMVFDPALSHIAGSQDCACKWYVQSPQACPRLGPQAAGQQTAMFDGATAVAVYSAIQ